MSLLEDIRSGKYTNIVVLTGAGISTSAGIPDYRSPTGVFTQLFKEFPQATTPEMLLTRDFADKYGVLQSAVFLKHVEEFKDVQPTAAHRFCKWLDEKGWLLRVYTQNIDGLHQKAGLSADKVGEFHGSLIDSSLVLYGDDIPQAVYDMASIDFSSGLIDLVLVLGTTLKVQPFNHFADAGKKVTRVIVDSDPKHEVGNIWELRGGCRHFINTSTDLFASEVMAEEALVTAMSSSSV